jgi:L-ascorbate metabolism protein UlaG (beta-lactamase superfamily)
MVPKPDGSMLQTTMDGKQAAKLSRSINAHVVVPLHFEGWNHFNESRDELLRVLKDEGVGDRFEVLVPGVATKIV